MYGHFYLTQLQWSSALQDEKEGPGPHVQTLAQTKGQKFANFQL